jgi:hypothetical protein
MYGLKGARLATVWRDRKKAQTGTGPTSTTAIKELGPAVKGGDQSGAGRGSTDRPASGTGKAIPETGTGNTLSEARVGKALLKDSTGGWRGAVSRAASADARRRTGYTEPKKKKEA